MKYEKIMLKSEITEKIKFIKIFNLWKNIKNKKM